jgi:hypothetical protein
MCHPYAITHLLLSVLSKPDPSDLLNFADLADDRPFRQLAQRPKLPLPVKPDQTRPAPDLD